MYSTDVKALAEIADQTPVDNIGKQLITTDLYPLYYRTITKCGCSFITSILHHLQFGYTYSDPNSIHRYKNTLPRATFKTRKEICESAYTFVVIRDPISRFMSLYFDKIYGFPNGKRHNISLFFIQSGLIDPDPHLDISGHRENCLRSIDWITRNLVGLTHEKSNWHWKPQVLILNRLYHYDFRILTLEDIQVQLIEVLNPLVPQIETVLDQSLAKNISLKPVDTKDILNDELKEKIANAYLFDANIHQEVSTFWQNAKTNQNDRDT